MPPESATPSGEAPILYADQIDQERLLRQRTRWLTRLRVNQYFIRKLAEQVFRCRAPADADVSRGPFATILRGIESRRSTVHFPMWRVAGTTVALKCGNEHHLQSKDMRDIDRVAEAYFNRGETIEPLRIDGCHQQSMELHEDQYTDHGLRPPLQNRFEHMELRRTGLRDVQLAADAKKVDLLRTIGFVQSEVLCRFQRCLIKEPPLPAADYFRAIRANRPLVSHIDWRPNVETQNTCTLSTPVVLGAAYYVGENNPRPNIDEFLESYLRDPDNFLRALSAPTRDDLVHALILYREEALPLVGDIRRQRGEDVPEITFDDSQD